MKQWKRCWFWFGFCLCLLRAGAQSDDRFLTAQGTTWRDEQNRDWVWLSLLTTDAGVYLNRSLAVFSKPGKFDAPGEYQLQSILEYQSSPLVIGVLIERARNLGGDPEVLASDMRAVFRDFQLDPSLTLAQQVAAVLQGSAGNPDELANVLLLAAKHPALALATGMAYAGQIETGKFTSFEIREWDAASGAAGPVVGRVMVEAGNPRILPAPHPLTEVVEETPRGNLNLRFRWGVPDELKRLSMLHFGFDVYRMTDVFAEGTGHDEASPNPQELAALLVQHPEDVVKVNRLPVLIPGNDDGVMDFFVDDNTTVGNGLTPLVDGDSYYYFVAARDILGRPGLLSEGLKLRVCDRYAPVPPRRLEALREREYNPETETTEDRLRIRWRQVEDDDISQYFVYRWDGMDEPGFRRDDPDHPKVPLAVVDHVPGEVFNSVVDTTLGPDDVNQHYIYTVQAFDNSSCGPNGSGHSGMVIDGLVNWAAPGRPEADMRIRCLEVSAVFKGSEERASQPGDPAYVALVERSGDPDLVEWVELRWAPVNDPSPENLQAAERLGRLYFLPGEVIRSVVIPAPGGVPVTVFTRAGKGLFSRTQSEWVAGSVLKSSQQDTMEISFQVSGGFVLRPPSEDCRVHEFPPLPDQPEGPDGLVFEDEQELPVELPPGTAEWRVYQRLNRGPQLLIAQGLGSTDAVNEDTLIVNMIRPQVCTRVQFYVQAVSMDGMEGPRDKVLDFFTGPGETVTPILAAPRSSGTVLEPEVRLRWTAPPYGLEGFFLYVGMTTPPPVELSPELSANLLEPGARRVLEVNGEEREYFVGVYRTGVIGSGFGEPGSGEFSLNLPLQLGQELVVAVAARSQCGESPLSNAMRVRWYGPQSDSPEVPWPARGLPSAVSADAYPGLMSAWLPENAQTNPLVLNQLGVRVGQFPWKPGYDDQFGKSEAFEFDTQITGFEQYFFAAGLGTPSLLPMMVFRMQVPSAAFPDVSGDVVQVTPLIESIAGQYNAPVLILRDPFFVALPQLGNPAPQFGELYLKDTQPVQRGATYQHLIVLFNERYEPSEVIALDPVEVPE